MKSRLLEVRELRRLIMQKMAEDILKVQPMPNIDFRALGESWLWQSFCKRHFKDK